MDAHHFGVRAVARAETALAHSEQKTYFLMLLMGWGAISARATGHALIR